MAETPEEIKQILADTMRWVQGTVAGLTNMGQALRAATEGMGEVNKAMSAFGQSIKSVQDAVLKLGGAYQWQRESLLAEINVMKEWQKASSKGTQEWSIWTQAIAKNQFSLREMAIKSAGASVTFKDLVGNLVKGRKVMTGIGNETVGARTALIASMMPSADGLFNVVKRLSPSMADAATETTNMAMSLSIVAGVGKALLDVLLGLGRGTVKTQRVLLGAFGAGEAGFFRSMEMFVQMNMAGAIFGANVEDQIKLLSSLTNTYALSNTNIKQVADSEMYETVHAFALGKAFDLSAESSMQLIATMKLFNVELKDMPDAMVDLRADAYFANLTFSDMTKNIMLVSNASLTVNGAYKSYSNTLVKFGLTLVSGVKPLLEIANKSTLMARHAKAMGEFSRMTSELPTPELLAFGGGLRPGAPGNLGDIIEKAINTPREQIMFKMSSTIMDSVTGSTKEQTAALAMFFNMQKGVEFTTAVQLANEITTMRTSLNKIAVDDKEGQKKFFRDNANRLSILANVLEDPQQKIVNLLQSLLMIGISMLRVFLGGAAASIASGVMQGARTAIGAAPEAAPGTGRR